MELLLKPLSASTTFKPVVVNVWLILCVHLIIFTLRVSRRRREMYCGHARLCASVCMSACLSAAACLHYCMDPDVTCWSGRGWPLVVHCWADLQSVYGLCCYGNTRNAWQSPVVICQAHRTHYACPERLCVVKWVLIHSAENRQSPKPISVREVGGAHHHHRHHYISRESKTTRNVLWSRACVCVCVSVCPRPHAYSIARTRM